MASLKHRIVKKNQTSPTPRSKGTSTILRIFEIGIFNWEAQEVEDALILGATANVLANLNILSGCH